MRRGCRIEPAGEFSRWCRPDPSALDGFAAIAEQPGAREHQRCAGVLEQINASDDRVDALEARMRLMTLLTVGIGLLLWSFFRPVPSDGAGGLGGFRKPRTDPPPSLC